MTLLCSGSSSSPLRAGMGVSLAIPSRRWLRQSPSLPVPAISPSLAVREIVDMWLHHVKKSSHTISWLAERANASD